MHNIVRKLLMVAAAMLAAGFTLPIALSLLGVLQGLPVVLWDVLQIGGLLGCVVFGIVARLTRPAPDQ